MIARFGRLLSAALLILVASTVLAQDEGQALRARVVDPFVLDGDLAEWGSFTPLLYGDAERVFTERSPLSRNWGGDADLSGRLYVGFTATDLVLAGDISDDMHTPNASIWYRGDTVELFLDLDLGDLETAANVYNDDDYQILLFPQSPGHNWGVVTLRGSRVQSDGGFDGVRTAYLRKTDDQGRYQGYTFEAAIPLANFPELTIYEGKVIGFDLALSDADGEKIQKTYMTLGARAGLSADPSRFNRLVFDAPPVAVEPPRAREPVWFVAAIIFTSTMLLALLLWVFRRPLSALAGTPIPRKLLFTSGLLLLLYFAHAIPEWIVSAARDRQREFLGQRVELVAETLAEADREWFLGTLESPPEPERIWAILTGGEAGPPPRYEFQPIWVRPPARSETLSRVPIIDFGRRLDAGDHARFEPSEPLPAEEVVLVGHLEVDPLSRHPLEPGSELGSLRILLQRNGEVLETPLTYFETLDDSKGAALDSPAEVAWSDPPAGSHANEVRVVLPEGAQVQAVEIVQTLEEGHLVVHGVTLLTGAAEEPRPLPLISRTLTGVPVNLWEDGPREAGVVLGPDSEPLAIPLSPPVDRVWCFYVRPTISEDAIADPKGTDKISLTLLSEDGERSEPVVLRSGIHIDGENLYTRRHPPEFEASLAWRWTPIGDRPRHRDAIAIEAGDFPAKTLEIAFLGGENPVLIGGVTTGRRLARAASGEHQHLIGTETEDRFKLSPDARVALQDVALTWYRSGRAVLSTIGSEQGGQGLLGAALPSGAIPRNAARWEPAGPEIRALGQDRYLSTFLPVTRGGEDCLEIALHLPAAAASQKVVDVVFYVLLAILLLTVLLILADLLSLLPRLRMRLTLGFAIAALVPLLLFFFGLSGILEREAGRSATDTLLEQVGLVRGQIDDMRDAVRRQARLLLTDEELLTALNAADPQDYLTRTDSLVRERAATVAPFSGPARVFIEDLLPVNGDPGPRVFPLGAETHPFLATRDSADDITYRWSELSFEGSASAPLVDGRRTVVVEVPIEREALDDLKGRFGQRLQILLFTVRGYPYRGTVVLDGEALSSKVEARRTVMEDIDLNRAPQVREEVLSGTPYVVAYDLVRTSDGEPVALVGVALRREELIAAQTDIRNLFLILGAVIVLLEMIVGSILTRRITEPLTSLSRGARAVSRGNLQTRVEVTGSDEIGALGNSFNQMTSELERRIGELSKLNSAIRNLSGSLDREHVLSRAIETFREAAGQPDGVLLVLGTEDGAELAAGQVGEGELEPGALPDGDGLIRDSLDSTVPRVVRGPFPDGADFGSPAAAATIPFEPTRDARGAVLLLYDRPEPGLSESDLEFLSTMAQQVAIALENARLYHLAIEDVATGLYIPSYFLARLREETDRAVTTGRPITVVLVSLGEIDGIYDTYGPEDGDYLMGRAAARVRRAVHRMNVLARADQSTIEIMLPETDKEVGITLATEIREALTRAAFPLRSQPERTIQLIPSIGLATCPDDAGSAEFLLNEAHGALYKAVTDRAGGEVIDVSAERERTRSRVERESGRFVFRSEKIVELLESVDRIAESDVPILIQGETGVGKEVLAELVHEKSPRLDQPLIKVNCAALPETLLESELFGYEKGAFTGADRRKPGRFELAEGGTIFLDEIGEIPPQTQVKLLRVLQDHQVERLGSTSPIRVDVRVLAATNRDLKADLREGRFREDLYFRLNVVSLVIPPLRARKEDIPVLVDHFVESYVKEHETIGKRLSPGAMDRLYAHSWPGNVRELKNTVERALVIARAEVIRADEIVFPEAAAVNAPPGAPTTPTRLTQINASDLNHRQQRLLTILARRDSITNREYADLVGVSARTGNRDLRELLERGLIVQVGKKRAAVYRLGQG